MISQSLLSAALECSPNPHFNNFNKDCTIRLRAEELFVDVTLATADRQVGQNIYSYEYIYSLYIRKHKYISVRIYHVIIFSKNLLRSSAPTESYSRRAPPTSRGFSQSPPRTTPPSCSPASDTRSSSSWSTSCTPARSPSPRPSFLA